VKSAKTGKIHILYDDASTWPGTALGLQQGADRSIWMIFERTS